MFFHQFSNFVACKTFLSEEMPSGKGTFEQKEGEVKQEKTVCYFSREKS